MPYERWSKTAGRRRIRFSFPITMKCLVDGCKTLLELGGSCTREEFIRAMMQKTYREDINKKYTKVLARDTWGAMRALGIIQEQPDIKLTEKGQKLFEEIQNG